MNVILDPALDGPTNMARDTALMEAAELGTPGARVYTWAGPWLSLGRFQRPNDVLSEMGDLPWVLRPTGGKAVRHGDDVTVSLAVPLATLGIDHRQVKLAYRSLARPLVATLQEIGFNAVLAEGTRWCGKGSRTADCFANKSPNDIVDDDTGEKVCGCALRLTERAVLLQSSIQIQGFRLARECTDLEVRATMVRDALAIRLAELDHTDRIPIGIGDGS